MTLPTLADPAAADELVAAIVSVAERSFFAAVDRSDEQLVAALPAPVPEWLVATVRFDDGPLAGSLACTLPEALGRALFDAFTGRDGADAPPPDRDLDDLVGEFSNMVCGAWLSRSAGDRVFRLSPPQVTRTGQVADAGGARLWVSIGGYPAAIDLHHQVAGA